MTVRPRVAVVVPTHGRSDRLGRLTRALLSQELPPDEVLIVDDASTDETPEVLEALVSQHAPVLRTIRVDRNRGPAHARNLGWRACTAELVAFTDDDCVPHRGWLSGLVDATSHDRGPGIVQGRTVPDPTGPPMGPFSRTLEVTHESGFYETCNILYRREVLEQLDGFDERYLTPAGEDTDLAWRARDRGVATTFVPDAVVEHEVRPSSFRAAFRDAARWGGVVLVARDHPHLRRRAHRSWIWRPAHERVLIACLFVATAVLPGSARARALRPVVGVGPYVWFRVREGRLRGSGARAIAAIPGAFLVDAAEVAALARASARHRTLFL